MKPARDRSVLKLEVAETYEAMSRRAEQLIVTDLKHRPALILCASAGETPTRLYELLAGRYRSEPRLFEKMRVLQIDEWGGLPPGHPASCEEDLRLKLLEPLEINKNRYVGFKSAAVNPEAECGRIAKWLVNHGPIDICLLGLGQNGHVAMNEPAKALAAHAHVAKLAPGSLNHAMLKDLVSKPRYGLTIGLGDILCSRRILLLVNGSRKRATLERLTLPEVTTRFPASFVWLHPQAAVLCDREAAPDHILRAPGFGGESLKRLHLRSNEK
jgi:galactosamine-6-phosphate isomerase